MVCSIEALVQVLQLRAQVVNVLVEVLEGSVSKMRETKSEFLTSSEKPGISYGMRVGQRSCVRIFEIGVAGIRSVTTRNRLPIGNAGTKRLALVSLELA